MSTGIPWFFVLAVVLMGGFALLCLVFVAIRVFGGGSGGAPPRHASTTRDTIPPVGALPPVIPDDQLTNPANPLYQFHHSSAMSGEPNRPHHHDPGPSASSFDASGGGATFDSGGSSSSSFDSGSSSTGTDSSGSNCG